MLKKQNFIIQEAIFILLESISIISLLLGFGSINSVYLGAGTYTCMSIWIKCKLLKWYTHMKFKLKVKSYRKIKLKVIKGKKILYGKPFDVFKNKVLWCLDGFAQPVVLIIYGLSIFYCSLYGFSTVVWCSYGFTGLFFNNWCFKFSLFIRYIVEAAVHLWFKFKVALDKCVQDNMISNVKVILKRSMNNLTGLFKYKYTWLWYYVWYYEIPRHRRFITLSCFLVQGCWCDYYDCGGGDFSFDPLGDFIDNEVDEDDVTQRVLDWLNNLEESEYEGYEGESSPEPDEVVEVEHQEAETENSDSEMDENSSGDTEMEIESESESEVESGSGKWCASSTWWS